MSMSIRMGKGPLLILCAWAAGPGARPAAAADEAAACKIAFGAGGRPAWELSVSEDAVRGDRTTLSLDGGVLHGFTHGRQTRLKIEPERVHGTLAGQRCDLHREGDGQRLLLRGRLGDQRFEARVSEKGLKLEARRLVVALDVVEDDAAGPLRLRDDSGQLALRLSGCDLGLLARRPGLLAVVDWLVHEPDQPLPVGPSPPPGPVDKTKAR
jgi:hypothetical protein